MATSRSTSKDRSSSGGVSALLALCLALGWVWLVAGTHLHEMIVGAVVVVPATLFLRAVRRSTQPAIHLEWKDIAQGWRIPWYIASDIWEITLVLFKDLSYMRRAGSYYRVCGFKSSKRDLRIAARGVLATVYTTTAPNSIVIGIDPELSRMLFHQLERTSVPRMTQALGAQS
jgi:multisubunit Na+/H+ antiporter MnhE subunit